MDGRCAIDEARDIRTAQVVSSSRNALRWGGAVGWLPRTEEPDVGIVPGMVRESPWIGHQGCHEASRNTTACGTPDDSGDSDLSDAPPLPTTASASGPRVHRAPGVPHALSSLRAGMQHPSDAHAPREREIVSQRQLLFEKLRSTCRTTSQYAQPSYAGLTRVSINRHEEDGSPGHRARRGALARR